MFDMIPAVSTTFEMISVSLTPFFNEIWPVALIGVGLTLAGAFVGWIIYTIGRVIYELFLPKEQRYKLPDWSDERRTRDWGAEYEASVKKGGSTYLH
jgi:predicted membrane channel-forming protein YqfA (hemolysin III family)